jgi:hypothetical protein
VVVGLVLSKEALVQEHPKSSQTHGITHHSSQWVSMKSRRQSKHCYGDGTAHLDF